MRWEKCARQLLIVTLGAYSFGNPSKINAQLSARITSNIAHSHAAPGQTSEPPAPINVIYFYVPPPAGGVPTPANPASLGTIFRCDDCSWTVTPWLTHNVSVSGTGTFLGTPDEIQVFKTHISHSAGHYTLPGGAISPVAEGGNDVIIEVLPSNNLPAIVSASFPAQPVNQPYAEKVTALEGPKAGPGGVPIAPQFVWNIDPSSLPPGLNSDANGNISGTPTTAGTYTIKATVLDSYGKSETGSVIAQIDASPGCNEAKYTNGYFNGWFPLSKKANTDPLGAGTWQHRTDSEVQCFYQTAGPTAVLTQVQYIYGFGGGANTLSADMVSFQVFAPIGTQVSLGTSVTGSTNQNSSSNSTSNTPSNASALQSVEAGGDFYFHILYPIVSERSDHLSFVSALDPKFGFSFNGFAGQSTLSQGSEQYFNVPLELNGSLNGILNQGGAFFDYRGGFESVPGGFAKAAGLPSHNFDLNELTFGIKFAGVLQIGAQHFWGPSAAFNASDPTGFNKWHLTLQLSPQI
jgi:hypothetical protein